MPKLFIRKLLYICFSAFFLSSCSYCEYYFNNKIELVDGDVITYINSEKKNHNLHSKRDIKNIFKENNTFNINQSFEDDILLPKYKYKFYGYVPAKPIFVEDDVIILRNDSTLMRWNLKNNILVWEVKILNKEVQNGGIAFDNNSKLIYVNPGASKVFAINFCDGSVAWSKTLDSGSLRGEPIITGNSIFVSSNDNKSYFLSTKDGSIKGLHSTFYLESKLMRSPISNKYNNMIITAYSNNIVTVFDTNTLNSILSISMDPIVYSDSESIIGEITSKPIVINDESIVIATGVKTYFFNIKTGILEQSINIGSNLDLIKINKNTFLIADQEENTVYLVSAEKNYSEIIWSNKFDKKFYDFNIVESNIVLTFDNGALGIIDIKNKNLDERITLLNMEDKNHFYITKNKNKLYFYSEVFDRIKSMG